MKITISGPQGVGKSTLLAEIEKHDAFEKFTTIKEVARTLMAQGVKINKGADHISQCRILEEHYKNTLRHPNMITDRCAVDAFAYATWDYLKGNYSYKEHLEHKNIFRDCLYAYDIHFYLQPEFAMVKDGVRDTDITYQQEIHEIFLKLYKDYSIKYTVLTGSVEQRMELFIKTLVLF